MKRYKILDVCCGSKMFWFNKNHPLTIYNDIRNFQDTLCDGRMLNIEPDKTDDFRCLSWPDNTFYLVIFDPPHLKNLGSSSWMAKKYGILSKSWQEDIATGFKECFRVLKLYGTLIFKWNEDQIKLSEILKLTPNKPLIGHKRQKTHFLVFIKEEE